MTDPEQDPLPTYILLENNKKSNNLGPVLRCAAAYGISTVLAIGYAQCGVDGSHGASKHVNIVAFPTAEQAISSIHKDRSSVSVVGVLGGVPIGGNLKTDSILEVQEDKDAGTFCVNSIGPEFATLSSTKQSFPVGIKWLDKTKIHCFAICKSKHGLSSLLGSHCDRFVHIPHRCMGGNFANHSLLDLPSSMSIVLHHYTTKAGYNERTFKGHKFDLHRVQQSEMENKEEKRNQREEAKKRNREEMEAEDPLAMGTGIFGDNNNDGDY